ncbi:MAG TPA: peptidyl-prolyl cis-trans isomerase [Caulobacteraceae bacterium]|nr:peptidyl-prolyl cis-trans isomerase [Caulobacteraceae bacterium]
MNVVDRPAGASVAEAPEAGAARVGSRWSQVNPTRSLLMMAAGAVLGLTIAGFGLFSARGTVTNTIPPEDVALVNNKPVLVSDFIAQIEAETGLPYSQTTPAQRRKVVNDMIREELFVQRGLELDFPASDPDTRSALVAAVEQQVAADVTSQQPTEKALRDYFNQHRSEYASDGDINLHELVLAGPVDAAAMAKAGAAVKALRAGAPLDKVMATYGLKESGRVSDGEEFYFAAKIHLGDKLFAVARTLPAGAVSDPQPAADGVHILSIISNHMPVMQTYEDAKEKVFFDYKKVEQAKLEAADEKYLRSKADIRLAKGFE